MSSLSFAAASSQYCNYAGAVVATLPVTMACWCTSKSQAGTRTFLSLNTAGSNNHRLNLGTSGTTNNPFISSRDGAGAQSAFAASNMGDRTWHHVGGVFASTTSRTCYLDGVAGTTSTASNTPSGWDQTSSGRLNSVTTNYLEGEMYWGAMWDVALDAGEMYALAKGAYPPSIRPSSLKGFWRFDGNGSGVVLELRNRFEMTKVNSPAKVETSPAVFGKRKPRIYSVTDMAAFQRMIGDRFALAGSGGLVA